MKTWDGKANAPMLDEQVMAMAHHLTAAMVSHFIDTHPPNPDMSATEMMALESALEGFKRYHEEKEAEFLSIAKQKSGVS